MGQKSLADDEEDMETSVPKRKTEREIELEQGDDYIVDLKKNYDLPEDQKYDIIPETWQGHNIADFIDPDIMEKLESLEKEEEARERAGFYESEESEEDESYAEIKELAGKIRHKKAIMKADQFMDNTTKATLNRKSVAKKMRLEEGARTGSVARSQSGLRDASQGAKLDKQQKKRDKKGFARMGKAGESDRRIQEKKPKHLFCGKRGIGKNDRR